MRAQMQQWTTVNRAIEPASAMDRPIHYPWSEESPLPLEPIVTSEEFAPVSHRSDNVPLETPVEARALIVALLQQSDHRVSACMSPIEQSPLMAAGFEQMAI